MEVQEVKKLFLFETFQLLDLLTFKNLITLKNPSKLLTIEDFDASSIFDQGQVQNASIGYL